MNEMGHSVQGWIPTEEVKVFSLIYLALNVVHLREMQVQNHICICYASIAARGLMSAEERCNI